MSQPRPSSDQSQFEWPWQYRFAPFFTLQPHAETRRRQLEAWCTLVLDYCRARRLFVLDVREMLQSGHELFANAELGRRLGPQAVDLVLEELGRRGQLEWLPIPGAPPNPKGTPARSGRCRVVWRTPEEWAASLARYADAHSLSGTVCTVYELLEGEGTLGEQFHGIDRALFLQAARVLEAQGRARLFVSEGVEGIKFV